MFTTNLRKNLGSLLLILALLGGCQTTGQPDRTTMAMGFAEAVYGLGVEPEGKHTVVRRTRLVRWDQNKDVILSIKGVQKGSPLYLRIVRDLQNLYQQASLTLAPGLDSTDQLLIVTVKDDPLLVTSQIKARCYTQMEKVRGGHLKLVRIVMSRVVLIEDTSNCLLHEGMHSLGFNGHPHRLDSSLSYTREQTVLTEVDRRLIDMLYHDQMATAAPLDESLTFAYTRFTGFRELRSRRPVPLDISLELTESESPLVLNAPFLADASRQFYYRATRIGNRSTEANYGLRSEGQAFAVLSHSSLASGYEYLQDTEISAYAESYESIIGPMNERLQGQVEHALGQFDYVVVDSSSYSCVITINRFDGEPESMISGKYCQDADQPVDHDDAQRFIHAIGLYDRNPLRQREQRLLTQQDASSDILAINLVGQWPLDGSYISALKLIAGGNTAGKILIEIGTEICQGVLTNIASSGLGKWDVDCELTEDASGRFSWDRDGSISFRGETSVTRREIDWTAYQVF